MKMPISWCPMRQIGRLSGKDCFQITTLPSKNWARRSERASKRDWEKPLLLFTLKRRRNGYPKMLEISLSRFFSAQFFPTCSWETNKIKRKKRKKEKVKGKRVQHHQPVPTFPNLGRPGSGLNIIFKPHRPSVVWLWWCCHCWGWGFLMRFAVPRILKPQGCDDKKKMSYKMLVPGWNLHSVSLILNQFHGR